MMLERRVNYLVNSYNFTLCLSGDGNVVSFGSSSFGELGHEDNTVPTPKIIPTLINIRSIACGEHHSACLDYNGCIWL